MKKVTFFVSVFLVISLTINAQGWLKSLGEKAKNAVKNAVENKVEQKTDETVNKAMDKAEDSVTKKGKGKKTDEAEENVSKSSKKTSKTPENASDDGENRNSSLQSYSKYDFVPGEKVIFFTDFSNTEVGDFPAEWNTDGKGEVVKTNFYEGKWLKYAGEQCIWTDDLLKLPENYTVEFDIVPLKGEENSMTGWEFRLMQAINPKAWDGGAVPGKAGFALGYEYYGRPYYRAYDNDLDGNFWDQRGDEENKNFWEKENQKYHLAFWIQKTRIRVYHGNSKLFDLPKAIPDKSTKFDRIRFDAGAAMITNIRVAVGAPDTRNKLLTEGKLVTYGIYFDVNKANVKPESYGTLKSIADVLKENADVRVKITGHTDSDGDDAKNLDLSKRRGAAVKDALVKDFGIDASRIESDGAGETQPVAKNDTPANKALNRRVEFVKL